MKYRATAKQRTAARLARLEILSIFPQTNQPTTAIATSAGTKQASTPAAVATAFRL